MSPDEIVGSDIASQILHVQPATITRMCRQKKFPKAAQDGPGQPWHIPLADIKEYQRLHTRNHQSKK